jgi:hypothetical protein
MGPFHVLFLVKYLLTFFSHIYTRAQLRLLVLNLAIVLSIGSVMANLDRKISSSLVCADVNGTLTY